MFADRLMDAIAQKRSRVVVGIDPMAERMPTGMSLVEFGDVVIDAVAPYAVAVKLQSAYYEVHGVIGATAFGHHTRYAKECGLLVIADVKRGDICSTATAYAKAYADADAVTVSPYLGSDGILPFVETCGGVFVLVKTSNPGAGELQDQRLITGETVSERVAAMVNHIGSDRIGECGYSSVGAVVGATYPQDLAHFRSLMPHALILVPGYGEQGGTAADAVHAFDERGGGAIVTASRSIIYAYGDANVTQAEAVRAIADAAMRMRDHINDALAAAGKA